MLSSLDQSALVLAVNGGGGEGFSGGVGSAARVDALITDVDVADVQTNKSEIAGHLETRAVFQQLSIEEPFNAKLGILFGFHVTFHVQRLSFRHGEFLLNNPKIQVNLPLNVSLSCPFTWSGIMKSGLGKAASGSDVCRWYLA